MYHAKTKLKESIDRTSSSKQLDDKLIGLHVYGNIYEPDLKVADDLETLKKIVLKAVGIAKMTLVEVKAWEFGGKKGGISVIALVTESHIALHVWREYKYATLDIYTCGEQSNPHAAFEYITKMLNPKSHQRFYADRSMMQSTKD